MIKLIKSSFYRETETKQRLVEFISRAEILSMGTECKKFEEAFAEKQQRKHAVFVSSGSSANLLLIQALLNQGKLNKGDVVGVSSLTWATNVMPIIELGLTPLAIDCEVNTLNISPEKLNSNCESLGSQVNGNLLGNFGLASTFSFFVGHHMSTIEGGMICTDDDDLYEIILMIRAHGWDRNLSPESQRKLRQQNNIDDFFSRYTFYDLAYNARPTEINGFLGNVQLQYLDEIIAKRKANFHQFQNAAIQNPDIISLKLGHMNIVSNFAMPVIFKNPKTFMHYRNKFEKNNVEIRPIIAGDITQQPFYKKYVMHQDQCPNSNLIHHQGFYFGNNPEMTEKELILLEKLLER
ncbi:MAG: DegT/DnrJ/EryC1/StrS aminotransferase [Parcubacteria group bacterium GW2011_GWA2_39_18]|nr:MAG: DegT/DnrJ/EryC1/StrS aminotransferase [Parcubacteria group bacterium GW2011_GWA2_39_18]